MIELSYENAKNGFQKEISMVYLYPTQQKTDRVFRNSLVLWGDLSNSILHLNEQLIDYMYDSGKIIFFQFSRFEAYASDQWRGFRGIYMLHPVIIPDDILPRLHEEYKGILQHNERYLDQWQA